MKGVARIKRFLRRPRAPTKDQDSTPQRPSRKAFPAGLKLLYSPNDGTIEYVYGYIWKQSWFFSPSIVFVHGLTGDREATWTARGATEPWPKTLLPTMLPTARVLTFGYDAYVADWRGVVSQSLIANHAWNLLTSLSSYRENDATVGQPTILDISMYWHTQNERPIVFVCHSLGGLVCEDVWYSTIFSPRAALMLRTGLIHVKTTTGTTSTQHSSFHPRYHLSRYTAPRSWSC
jgi:pimeloyl-ACP methyl ester carboxylesterase